MIFGNLNQFAIEAELLEIFGKWTYGKLRFWINGHAIGDFEDTSDLASSARWGRTFLKSSSRRTRGELDQMAAPELYELLHGRFVESLSAPSSKPLPGYWDRDPYLLDEVGESAIRDKFAILVVRKGDESDRVLVNSYHDEHVSETLVCKGSCDRVIAEYCSWVEGLRG